MIKERRFGYEGMTKDIAKNKDVKKYYDARNIRIVATDQESTYAITNEAGNELVYSIPSPEIDHENTSFKYTVGQDIKYLKYTATSSVYPRCQIEEEYLISNKAFFSNTSSGNQTIVGIKELRDSVIIVTTDNNGWDCIWELEGLNDQKFNLELKYLNNLNLSSNNLMQIIFNYENSVIEKIYMVDGVNQIRYLNLRQSIENGDTLNLVDLPPNSIDSVGTFNISQPKVTNVFSGGSHSAGMIQYAYSLYILNGAQTVVSPLSPLTPIDKGDGLGGGEVNEELGKSITVTVDNIDSNFTHIKLYSIKYTSYNEIPEIQQIADQEIDSTGKLSFTDTGADGTTLTLESFIFLGASPVVPKAIQSKDGTLFAFNVKESIFSVKLDTRSYSFNSSGVAKIMENVSYDENGDLSASIIDVPNSLIVSDKHDSINANYDVYKYQSNGTTLGASGMYIDVQFLQTSLSDNEAQELQFFKDNEFYRIGIKFFNRRGQYSDPSWIMDMRAPEGNLNGNYNQLKVSFTNAFDTWLADSSNFDTEDDKPVGYKIVRADRQLSDRTILAQGMINPMIANYAHRDKFHSISKVKDLVDSDQSNKMPSLTRMFQGVTPVLGCKDYHDLAYSSLSANSFSQMGVGRNFEGVKMASGNDWVAQNFQQNRLMQMFSPEVSFLDVQTDSGYKLNVRGLYEQDYLANWSAETSVVTDINSVEAKFYNGFNNNSSGVSIDAIEGTSSHLMDFGIYGPVNSPDHRATHQIYQSFTGDFHKNTGVKEFEIYGTPEVTEVGADYTAYNNDYSFRYCNHLKTMLIDNFNYSSDVNDDSEVQVRGVNSNGARCITLVEGTSDAVSRKSIEAIYAQTGISETKGVLVAELKKEDSFYYAGGVYGGNTYEAKSNSIYIDIGNYTAIDKNEVIIESPGDTFVSDFVFTKLIKDDTEIASTEYNQMAEIVRIKVETTVDLKNRNDLSIGEWDNRWQPLYNEYQEYNKVYSQQPTLVKSNSESYKLKKAQEFDSRIIATGVKTPGEFVDSWTDFLENEELDLDGKYGPINSVVNFRDNIYALQDRAVAVISINPRVQTVGSDGVSVELGTGGLLYDYNYLTTTTGCLNKLGVIETPIGFYFVDILNKCISFCNGQSVINLSDKEGFHSELFNKLSYEDLVNDNPVTDYGISLGYNPTNKDVYFSFNQSKDSFTLCFNERTQSFVSYYDYIPAWFINKGSVMLTTDKSSSEIWQHFKGKNNSFYGEAFPSSITLHLVAQEKELVMNGASYRLEVKDADGNVLANEGLSSVKVWTKHLESDKTDLKIRKNAFRRVRDWNIKFPRVSESRDRVRGPWAYAEFTLNNNDGKKIILHDITLFYTE